MRLKLNATKPELIWLDRRSRLDDESLRKQWISILTLNAPPSDVIRDLGVLLDCRLNMSQHVLLHGQNTFFPPSQNSTGETLSWQNMSSYSYSSSRHLPTRLLQLCPLRSPFGPGLVLVRSYAQNVQWWTKMCSDERLFVQWWIKKK